MRLDTLKNFGGNLACCGSLTAIVAVMGCSGGDTVSNPNPIATGPQAGSFAPVGNNMPVNAAPNQPVMQGGNNLPDPDQGQAPVMMPPANNQQVPTNSAAEPFCGALSVFRTSCQGCHGSELIGGAPMPLVTHADMIAPAASDPTKQVWELIGPRIHDTGNRPMPPLSQEPLKPDAISAVDAWLDLGAPDSATGTCEGIVEAPTPADDKEPEWPADCEEHYEIRANDGRGGPYRVPANAELNINIEIPVPWAGQGNGPVQALAIKPISNNKRVVHHWILYAGVGDFITSWSPGKPFEVFPEDVGVHLPTSGNFRLNMHYYNVGNNQDELDDSGLEVCITRSPRKYTATTHMFGSIGAATVPSGGMVSNDATCTVTASEPVHIITSSPHMHSYGVGAKMEVIRTDGSVEVIEDGPFSWEEQHVTPVDVVVNSGDQIRITCEYFNDSGRTVTFGSSSDAEMCFNFARYYPMDAFTCSGGVGGFGGLPGGGFPGF